MKFIVLCGGYGTKLWPISRKNFPKQFTLKIKGKTLFRHNIDTLLKRYSPNDIILATSKENVKYLKQQAPEISQKNYILEPTYKNQGAATVLVASKLFTIDPDEPFTTVQSDVVRYPSSKYLSTLKAIEKIVIKSGKLVTSGSYVKFPQMGIDYLLVGEKLNEFKQIEAYNLKKILFRTDYKKIALSIKNSKVFAHTNHYSWTPRKFLDACRNYIPNWGKISDKLVSLFKNEKLNKRKIDFTFSKIQEGTMEDLTKHITREMVILKNKFLWFDFGTWESIANYMQFFEKGKIPTNYINIDSKNNFIKTTKGKLVATLGLENMAIIDTKDALLVCPLDRSGEIGEIIKKIKRKKLEKYL